MSDNKKPRICEVLGVEVGEKFTIKAQPYDAVYRITESGNLLHQGADGAWRPATDCTVALVSAINHPESMERKPRWTEDDIADAKAVRRLWPTARYAKHSKVYTDISESNGWHITYLNLDVFPSLEPDESVDLDEILEAENG